MGNMSYCRFENTSNDLKECLDHFGDKLSKSESEAREDIIRLAYRIVNYVGVDVHTKQSELKELIKEYTETCTE